MNTNKILLAGAVGGVVALVVGFLLFGIGLAGFFEANAGSATGVNRSPDEMLLVPLILGHLILGLMFSYIFGRWANISTFSTGLSAGAILGLLFISSTVLIDYATTNLMNLTSAIVSIVVGAGFSAVIGGVVGYMLGRGDK